MSILFCQDSRSTASEPDKCVGMGQGGDLPGRGPGKTVTYLYKDGDQKTSSNFTIIEKYLPVIIMKLV